MINTKYLLCISTCLLFSGNVQASDINLTYDSSGFLPGSFSLHTLHTPSELRPTSLFNPDNSVKLAAVCSVGGGGCSGLEFGKSNNSMNLDNASLCQEAGYSLTSCPNNSSPKSRCPHNSAFFDTCVCDTSYYTQSGTYSNQCGSRASSETCTDSAGNKYYRCSCDSSTMTTCSAGNQYSTTTTVSCKDTQTNQSYVLNTECKTCTSPAVVNSSENGCTCPSTYAACGTNQIGVGTVCTENNVNKYTSCKCPDNYVACNTANNEVGNGKSCTLNGVTKYESCKCNDSWVTCGTNQEGVGGACTIGGTAKYASCKCPASWSTCSDTAPDAGAKSCSINGTTYYSNCKPKLTDCASLVAKINAATEGSTINIENDVTCTNQSITLKAYQKLVGNGETYLRFKFTQDVSQPGIILADHSEVRNLNIDVDTLKRNKPSQTVSGVTSKAGALNFPSTSGNNIIENVNITVKADTDPLKGAGSYPMVSIETSNPITFKGNISIKDKGSICTEALQTTPEPPVNMSVHGIYGYNANLTLDAANVDILTNGCWGTGFDVGTLKIQNNSKVYIETHGTFASALDIDKHLEIDNSNVDIYIPAERSRGIYISSTGLIKGNSIVNIKQTHSWNFSVISVFIGGSNLLTLQDTAQLNVYTTSPETALIDGDIRILGNAQFNGKATGKEAKALDHCSDITMDGNGEFNADITGNSSSGIYGSSSMYLNSTTQKFRLRVLYGTTFKSASSTMLPDISAAVVGSKIYTSQTMYTCTSAISKETRIPEGNLVTIPNFSSNTASKLTSMPSEFNSIFNKGVFLK